MLDFNYWEPVNLWEAVSLLSNLEGQVSALAGGTDLLVKMKKNQLKNTGVINLKKLEELKEIAFNGQTLTLGALTNISTLIENVEINSHFPVLKEAARSLGTPQIRNLATIGGNLCNASPAADVSLALLLYDARLTIIGQDGQRKVKIDDFFTGPGQTVLKKGEIIKTIEIDLPPANSKGVYIKHGRRKSHEIALVNVAVLLVPQLGSGQIAWGRIAVGAVAATPLRAASAENILKNAEGNKDTWSRAAKLAMEAVNPIDDVRSTAFYRKQMVGVLTKRALLKAWGEK